MVQDTYFRHDNQQGPGPTNQGCHVVPPASADYAEVR